MAHNIECTRWILVKTKRGGRQMPSVKIQYCLDQDAFSVKDVVICAITGDPPLMVYFTHT
jgi:hypothetical protein